FRAFRAPGSFRGDGAFRAAGPLRGFGAFGGFRRFGAFGGFRGRGAFRSFRVFGRGGAIRGFGRGGAIRGFGRGGAIAVRHGVDGVAAELVAQSREHAVAEVAVAARAQARVERGGDHGRRHVVGGRVLDRPAPLAGVLGVALERFQVVAVLFEGACRQFAQP